MIPVSNEYSESMKMPLRNRADALIAIGNVNPDLQTEAKGRNGYEAYAMYFAREDYLANGSVFRGTARNDYATYEQDFVKADGKMLFPPRQSSGAPYVETGYVSNGMMDEQNIMYQYFTDVTLKAPITIRYEFHEECVPDSVQIQIWSGSSNVFATETPTGNKVSHTFSSLPTFNGEDYIFNLITYSTANDKRARIKNITFGDGTVIFSDIIENVEVREYCSKVNEDLPTQDFTLKLINYESRYDADNPDNPLKILDNANQEINAYLGYDVEDNGNYEWLHVANVLSAEWSSSKFKATITGVDRMRNEETLFIHEYQSLLDNPKAGAWIRMVMATFGNEIPYEYDGDLDFVDMDLSLVRTLPCKEILQQIANYCRKTMYINGDGRVVITNREDTMYEETVLSTDSFEYGGAQEPVTRTYSGSASGYAYVRIHINAKVYNPTIGRDENIVVVRDITIIGTNYTYVLDTDDEFICDGRYGMCYVEIIGYKALANPEFEMTAEDIIEDISTEKEELIKEVIVPYYTPVVIKIDETQIAEDVFSVPSDGIDYGVDFGDTFYADKLVTVINMNNLTTASSFVRGSFNDNGQDTSSTTRLRSPFIDVSDFGSVRLEVNSEVEVYGIGEYNSSQNYLGWKQIDKTEATVELRTNTSYIKILVRYPSDGTIQTSALTSAFCGGAWTFDDEYAMNPFDPTDYYTQYFDQTWGTELKIIITAKSYINFTSTPVSYQVNDSGKSLTWENPLVGTPETALAVATWIGEYLRSNILYKYNYRGNPELEANDVILQENDFVENMKVVLTEHNISFNGAFKGELKTRRRIE